MLTFKEYFMLQEAPVVAPTRRNAFRNRQARDNNDVLMNPNQPQGRAVGAAAAVPTQATAAPGAQQIAQKLSNNQQMQTGRMDPVAPQPTQQATTQAAPQATTQAAPPETQDPVSGPSAIVNRLGRVSNPANAPEQQVQDLLNLKQQYDQGANDAYFAAKQERDAGADGPAVDSLRDWNQANLKMLQQSRALRNQLANNPELADQLKATFGEHWELLDKGLPIFEGFDF